MKTGDTIRDTSGAAWQVGQALGRGLWGKTYLLRREFDDVLFVLKVPLAAEDFRAEFAGADAVISASRAAVLEQARIYGEGGLAFLPRLEARAALTSETTGFILPQFPATLEDKFVAGMQLGDQVEVLLTICKLVRQLPGGLHGNLRAKNVLFGADGSLFFSDVLTPSIPRALPRMLAASLGHAAAFPPEVSEAQADVVVHAGCDCWAIAMMLWEGVFAGDTLPNPPRGGLDKAGVQQVRDRVLDRMRSEEGNPRFHARLAERIAMLLSRALSREQAPSPPFRFSRIDDLAARLEEITQLIRPSVQSVGKVMLDRPASKPWFTTDETANFSCLAAASQGVEGHDEISVGIAVFDIASNERLKDLELGYSCERHPSGRYRFAFTIGGLYPGNFRARLAFAIRDSGHAPTTAEVEFLVRPAPGWIPPEVVPPPASISFERESPSVTVTTPPPAPEDLVGRPMVTLPQPPRRTPEIAAPQLVPNSPPERIAKVSTAAVASPGPSVDTVVPFPRTVPPPEPLPPVFEPEEVHRVAVEEDPVRLKADWDRPRTPKPTRDLDDPLPDEDAPPAPAEPSPLDTLWASIKNDPYVLALGGLIATALLLVILVLIFR